MATRTFTIRRDAHVIQTPDSGAGVDDHLNIGLFSTYLHRSLIEFYLDFSGMVTVTQALLYLRASNAHGSIGASSGIEVQRNTTDWNEGTVGAAEEFSSSNAVTWSNQPSTVAGVTDAVALRTDEAWDTIDITAIVNAWKGGAANFGLKLLSVNEASAAHRTAAYSRESAYDPYILVTYTTNSAPTAPTLTGPAAGAVVSSLTPTFDFTHNDPDGDNIGFYGIQVDNNSDFSSPLWDTGSVVTADNTPSIVYAGPALVRGSTYYWRARTWDASGVGGPYSAGRAFTVGSLPIGTVTSPAASVVAPLYYTAGSDTTPKLKPVWTFSCAEGGTQASASVKVYDEAGTTLLHTHAHTGSLLTASLSGFAPTNGTKYQISVTPTCSHAVAGVESGKKLCRVRCGRASYRADLVTAPTTLLASVISTLNNGQVVVEYASSAATTPEPTDWKATIAEVTKLRYVWHRATLLPQAVASPTSPALNSVTFSYSGNALSPDNWIMAGLGSVDEGTFVYGTQSLKHTTDGTVRYTYQDLACLPDTNYVLSGRVKTVGAPGALLRVLDDTNTIVLATVSIPSDSEWAVFSTPVFNSGGNSQLRLTAYTDGASGTAWFDAIKIEASTVVTPWTPGFLGKAVTIDAGGLMVDQAAGGVFRLKSTNGGVTGFQSSGDFLVKGYGRLRFVPFAHLTLLDSTVTASVASTLTAAIAGLPTHAKAVQAMLRVTSSTANAGNNAALRHAVLNNYALIAYAGSVANFFTGAAATVEVDSAQKIRYEINWVAGNLRILIGITGYWTDDNG